VSSRPTRGSGSAQIRATNYGSDADAPFPDAVAPIPEADEPEADDPVPAPSVKSSSRVQTEPTRQDFVPTKKLKKTCLFHCEGILYLTKENQKRKRFPPCPQAKFLFQPARFQEKVELLGPPNDFHI
jgi:hypothetical protein